MHHFIASMNCECWYDMEQVAFHRADRDPTHMTNENGMNGRAQREERANVWTHAIGVAGAVTGAVLLIVLASRRGDPWSIVGVSVFGASMILLYLASTLYHAARAPRLRARLKVLDHAAIYLLIAGTYTPFTIGALRGGWGWSLFGVIWGLAVAGVVFKLFFTGRFRLVSTAIYIAMGWLVLIAVGPLMTQLTGTTLAWLVAGGIAYTAGTPLYHASRIPYAHAFWHLFVIAGSACHAIAIAFQIGTA
jgi:hemolysin III